MAITMGGIFCGHNILTPPPSNESKKYEYISIFLRKKIIENIPVSALCNIQHQTPLSRTGWDWFKYKLLGLKNNFNIFIVFQISEFEIPKFNCKQRVCLPVCDTH